MKIPNNNFLLRFPMAIILFIHGIGGMFNNGVNDFGNFFLNQIGFAPFGVYLAWLIKISHLVCAISLLLNKYIKWPAIITIFMLIMGIVLVHFKAGWFVVGGGRNGWEYNFLLIFVLLAILFPNGIKNRITYNECKKRIRNLN